ncbi:MAG: DUF2723 domain-containing protein [Verrucomicrobiota bacterium]|nr:DUF2723 domain-containing protein [Verrucomicrobiota bacterium]
MVSLFREVHEMAKSSRRNKHSKKPAPKQEAPPEAKVELFQTIQTDKPETDPFFCRTDWIAALLTTLISLSVYLYTLAPDVTLEDSGELAVGSMYAGVPHPPGYPMWTIYSWFFTKILPFSNIAWRVAVSSAVAAALSCGLLTLMVSRSAHFILSGIEAFKEVASNQKRKICLTAGISAGLIFGYNGFIWSQAVIVEVYALGILTFTLTLAFLMRWFFRPKQRLYLYLAYFTFGLCFVNHQTLILAAVGIEILILLADYKLGRDFLTGNCALYIIGLSLSLKGAVETSAGNPGLFLLYNLVGTGLMGLLITTTIRMPRPELKALVASAYLGVGLIFGLSWNAFLDKQQFAQANIAVKLWAFLNLLTLLALIAYSWLNQNKEEKEAGLLSNWMVLLGTRAVWVIAALLYFYLPIASMTNPPMNWAYPRTVNGFKHSITRGQYDKIMPSNFTRMFINHSHNSPGQQKRGQFNGGQLWVYFDEAQQEFSLSYLALAFIPLTLIHRLRLREVKWILGLTGIYISFTLILIYLINPTADELNRHLNKVFFAATHVFIAGGIGLGLTIISATICKPGNLRHILILLGCLILWEIYNTLIIQKDTVFAMKHYSAYTGLALLFILTLITIISHTKISNHILITLTLIVICILPLRPALNNWAENEQRNHLFGYWYGHDMFSPPFEIYPEMKKNAVLFGGTDPGRFCPTYMIFCESFIASHNKRDPNFDRRDVYLITQNALADGTYLQYIRAHYNRSTQRDPKFFSELAAKINNSSKRTQINALLTLGLIAGLIMIFASYNRYQTTTNRRHTIGIGAWGLCLTLLCFSAFTSPLDTLSKKADSLFGKLGSRVEQQRRENAIYPKNEINTPSDIDNQFAFSNYYADAKDRMLSGTLKPGEDVRLILSFLCTNCLSEAPILIHQQNAPLLKQIESNGGQPCPRCGSIMPIPDPQVSVQGHVAVMNINARLAKMIFDNNPDHEFYLEESFPMDWMYPHLRPFGIIMKIEREPVDEFDESVFNKDRKFWRKYSKRLIGDWISESTTISEICDWAELTYQRHDLSRFKGSPEFIRDNDAQKGFSKLRSAIAGLYAWRALNTNDPELKIRYNKEAHFAYKQAFAFGSINPETVFKFINLLATMGKHGDALRIAQTYRKLDPANPSSLIFIKQVLQTREQQFLKEGKYNEAAAIAKRLHKLDPSGNHNIRADFYRREASNDAFFLTAFEKNPHNSTNFLQAIYIHGRNKNTNAVIRVIDKYSKFSEDDPKKLTLIKNSYRLIEHWKEKEAVDQRLAEIEPDRYESWFDLAQTRIRLGKTNEAVDDLIIALKKHKDSETNSTDIRSAVITNDLFKPIRDHPEIKTLLKTTP